jgi:nucleoside-diphosphate-sugar epimerase
MVHTILGAGGSIGIPLAEQLLKRREQVRLVSRSGYSMEGARSVKANITSYDHVLESIKGSDVVYLTAGLPYNYKVWKEQWPKIMRNCIAACAKEKAKFIFFDNVYAYGQVAGSMTEQTPYNPCSRKGQVRTEIALILEREMRAGNVRAVIARAADLYGPDADRSSIMYLLVINRFLNGKKPQWMGNPEKIHSFSYNVDCAKGLILLAKDERATGQVWHLPTYNPPMDGKSFITLVASELNLKPDFTILKKWTIHNVGHFIRKVGELEEMLYQYENDYYFDSSKFNAFFKFNPTRYQVGMRETVQNVLGKQI